MLFIQADIIYYFIKKLAWEVDRTMEQCSYVYKLYWIQRNTIVVYAFVLMKLNEFFFSYEMCNVNVLWTGSHRKLFSVRSSLLQCLLYASTFYVRYFEISFRSRNHNVPAYPYVHGTGQAQVMSRSTPASHLGTNDDYVLDIALLNDSLAIRQAGICVQQHRNGQHKNHRHPVDASPREQATQR